MLRSVGGDELNVCVALSRLDGNLAPQPQYVSVLPTGPLGLSLDRAILVKLIVTPVTML